MESSDDEAKARPLSVSNYHFEDGNDEPVSFSVLPIQWSESERIGDENVQIFLYGNADNGLQKIYKHVIAWKFDLSNAKPEISVLSKENCWIKLLKPRKSFEGIVRSILMTVHCLHFVMRHPEISGKSLWSHMLKLFSLHEVKAFESELVDHSCLITEAFTRNEALAKSKFLFHFLNKNPKKRKLRDEYLVQFFNKNPKKWKLRDEDFESKAASGFVVDMVDDIVDVAEEDKSSESHDIYDDLCAFCDEGGDLLCCEGRCLRSFHATKKTAMDAKSHCDSLGLTKDEVDAIPNFLCKNCEYKQHQCFICGELGSSDTSSGAQVFCCASITCGQFYHPHCLSSLLHQDNNDSAEEIEKKIAEGRSFTCPIHKCYICKQGENKRDPDLQFAVCRRCPKSYHRKCLPRKIAFEGNKKEGIVQRAWKDLLPNRILIYCLEHKMDERIETPARGHIIFPDVEEKKTATKKSKSSVEHTSSKPPGDSRKTESNTRIPTSVECNHGTAACETLKRKENTSANLGGNKDNGKLRSATNVPMKVHVNYASKKKSKSPTVKENKSLQKRRKQETNKSAEDKPVTKKLCRSTSQLDSDTDRRLLDLVDDVESSINLEDIRKKFKVPSTHTSLKDVVNETITMEKVQSSVEAVRPASQILEEVGNIEDAKAVCEPEILGQIFNWKIVNKLHDYVEGGDMIVDICYGDNDFNLLMKKKLEERGKKCFYKNYDLLQAKIDDRSEKRDWMTVQQEELLTGSKLIMGLNLPFGVKAAVANEIIDKALEFKPKLILLMLPRDEAQRLDEKTPPYDLIWEDHRILSGESFYLLGSVDSNEKQIEKANVKPPVLYLWSHPDCYAEHDFIAQKYGHFSMQQDPMEKSHAENLIVNYPTHGRVNNDIKYKQANEHGRHESRRSLDYTKKDSKEKRGEWQNDKRMHGRARVETATECKLEMHPSHVERGGNFHQNFQDRLSPSPMEQQWNDTKKHGRSKVESATEHKSQRSRSHAELGGHSHEHYRNCMSASPTEQRQQNDTKRHGRTKNETASERKSGMSPPHTELGGRSHHTFRNYVPASPTESVTTFREKRARTSDDKFGRHYMNSAEHGTDHYSARNRFGNRDYINGNKQKHKEESNIRSQDLHSSGSNYVAGQKSGHSQMGSLTLNSHSCRNPTPSVAEPSYPIEASTMQHSPRDDFEYTRSRLYARSSGMDFALGPNLEYSSTHSAGWLEPDE